MIVVTGGEGFIGRNLIMELQKRDYRDVVPVDTKYETLDEIYGWLHINAREIECIFHLGAITDTTEMNKDLFDEYNVNCSKFIWNICAAYGIPLIYASSAATYGDGTHGFDDEASILPLEPLNPYGWSKQEFDMYTLSTDAIPPFWYGLKFFNVYGYGEHHKGKMSSVAFQLFNQLRDTGYMKLFKSHHPDYKDGEQLRDFICVDDVVDICIWLYENKPESGIYNVGTGKARSFNDIAKAIFYRKRISEPPTIEYIDTPIEIRDKYQYFTEAKISKLRNAGYSKPFCELENGIYEYVRQLEEKKPEKIRLHTYGDSHGGFGWNIPLSGLQFTDVIINVLAGPTTMSRIALEKIDYFNLSGTALQNDEAVCFCFGEIDCRVHLSKSQNFPNHRELIDEIVPNYFRAIEMNVELYKNLKVMIFNVPPTARKELIQENPYYPHEGTDEERKTVTLYMNTKLKEYCEKYNYIFFDVYDKYCDKDGLLNPELSNDIHIKNNIYMVEFLKNLKIF